MEPLEGHGIDGLDPQAEMEREQRVITHEIQELGADPLMPLPGLGPDVVIGVDAEWVSDSTSPENNIILSVQLYLIGECGELGRVIYPSGTRKANRPSLIKSLTDMLCDALHKGHIAEWPRQVHLCGYFLRADLTTFSDLDKFKNEIDSVGGSVATTARNAVFPVTLDTTAGAPLREGREVVDDPEDRSRWLSIRFIDLARHTAVGTPLSKIGESLGLEKLSLPVGHSIERMDVLLKEDRAAFEAYGLRDAEIAARFYRRLEAFAVEHAGCAVLPPTAGALTVRIFKKSLEALDTTFSDLWGEAEVRSTHWDQSTGKVRTTSKREMRPELRHAEPLVIDAYHGGRNESFWFGPSGSGPWFDYDLRGAYTTALLDFRRFDYSRCFYTKELRDFCGHVVGFARLRFKHPDGTRFPALPVSTEYGVLFPLVGETCCTAPEIQNALALGCEIEILNGIVFPWVVDDDRRLFEPFVLKVWQLRQAHARGSVDETYAKLIGNSLPGKAGQGLNGKRAFNTRTMSSMTVPRSALTHAVIAAHTTGFVRAVMSEQLASVPAGRSVISVTTDGYITNAPADELRLDGPLSRRFQSLTDRIGSGGSMLECKHLVQEILSIKTRGQATLEAVDGQAIILAKAGVSPPVPRDQHNQFMLNLFASREAGQKIEVQSFVSLRDQWLNNRDLVKHKREVQLNLEYDMKRMPHSPRVMSMGSGSHVAFATRPWPDAETAARARSHFDGWRRKHTLKSLVDYDGWQEGFLFNSESARLRASRQVVGINMTAEGAVGIARRMFLRFYAQDVLGIERGMSYSELAAWLTAGGHETKLTEIKNASRAALIERRAPRTAAVMAFLGLLVDRFPGLDVDRFLIPG